MPDLYRYKLLKKTKTGNCSDLNTYHLILLRGVTSAGIEEPDGGVRSACLVSMLRFLLGKKSRDKQRGRLVLIIIIIILTVIIIIL